MKLQFQFNPAMAKVLRSRGVDGGLLAGTRNEFVFANAAQQIKPKIPGSRVKSIGTRRQSDMLTDLLENPLRGNPIIAIGSHPSDQRAKLLAVNIMYRAILYQDKFYATQRGRQEYPLWHKVYGGLRDELRDDGLPGRPSMLIYSNIDVHSTNYKLEKLRDLLEKYNDVPRVVIVAGCDPVEFFGTKIHLSVSKAFYVGPSIDREEFTLDTGKVHLDI